MQQKFHAPTGQYAFLEIDFTEDEEQKALALYNKYALETVTPRQGVFSEVKTFTGETILYDPIAHVYKSLDGKKLISGSQYKKSLEEPFSDTIAASVANKYNLKESDVREMWDMNGSASMAFGTSLHKALELYRKHYGKKGAKEYFLPTNEILRAAVLAFPEITNGVPEVFVSAVEKGMVGQIDWLTILGDKTCTIDDYKSDADWTKKKADGYFNQLTFYAHIMIHHGWSVQKLRLWNYQGGEWKLYESDVLPLK